MNQNQGGSSPEPAQPLSHVRRIYADIIDLPHHVSPTHPRMSAHDRAAQFSPFAALTGYGRVIAEAEKRLENPES